MSEPAKFALKDTVWKELLPQYLKASLLYSSPQDAVKWLLVSKDIKTFIEENREKMRPFKHQEFELFVKEHPCDIQLRCRDTYHMTHYVDCRKPKKAPTATSPILERITDKDEGAAFVIAPFVGSKERKKWRLTDTSPAGIQRFIRLISHWFAIDQVYYQWKLGDIEVIRPLAENGVCVILNSVKEYDDTVMDAIESLRIRSIHFYSAYATYTNSFLRRIREASLETVYLTEWTLVQFLDCPFVHFISYFFDNQQFTDWIVTLWFEGERPHLKEYNCKIRGMFNCPLLHPVDYVPTEPEQGLCFIQLGERYKNRGFRVYRLTDQKGDHIMQVKTHYFVIDPEDYYSGIFTKVEVRIVA